MIEDKMTWLKLDWATALLQRAFTLLTENELTALYLTLGLIMASIFSIIGVVSYAKQRD